MPPSYMWGEPVDERGDAPGTDSGDNGRKGLRHFPPTAKENRMQRASIALVQASFTRISPDAARVAAHFYRRLFELDPGLRPLFRGDIDPQGLKLMATLQLAVAALDNPARIAPALRHLGRSHLSYGVRDGHYATVGAALLDTLDALLGAAFTPALRAAWAEAYELLSAPMRDAAQDQAGLAAD